MNGISVESAPSNPFLPHLPLIPFWKAQHCCLFSGWFQSNCVIVWLRGEKKECFVNAFSPFTFIETCTTGELQTKTGWLFFFLLSDFSVQD